MSKIMTGVLGVALVASLGANALLYTRYSSSRPLLHMEGGDVVTRKEFRDAVEHRAGKDVLKKLVFARLVDRAVEKAGLTPTEDEINQRLREIERFQPSVTEAAKRSPVKLAELKADVKNDLALENLRIKDVTVTPQEIARCYQRNRDRFTNPVRVETTTVFTQNNVDAGTAADLLRQGMSPDVIARQRGLFVVGVGGFSPNLSGLPPAKAMELQQTMTTAKTGDVKTVQLTPQSYLTFRIKNQSQASIMPLATVKDQVERLARLEKAPPGDEILARLYHRAGVVFEMNQYASYFSDLPKVAGDAPRQTASAH